MLVFHKVTMPVADWNGTNPFRSAVPSTDEPTVMPLHVPVVPVLMV